MKVNTLKVFQKEMYRKRKQKVTKEKLFCCSLLVQRVEELEEALKKKDEDMKQMEDRYKKYLEKAKSVSVPFLLVKN